MSNGWIEGDESEEEPETDDVGVSGTPKRKRNPAKSTTRRSAAKKRGHVAKKRARKAAKKKKR